MQRRSCRYCHGRGGMYQRTAVELQRDRAKYDLERAAWERKKKRAADAFPAFDEQGGIGYDPRRDPNPKCQRCWGDGVARVLVKDTRRLSPAALRLYAGVKETQHGVDVRMRDQDGALLNVAKHLGMLVERVETRDKTIEDLLDEAERESAGDAGDGE
ncbi:terminase small subunit [Gemmatirosa kalamazoonensis]|uniref:terminase small subunit n=1 Tax=Gemmatirosa kalamazoonensis TaxID=861299 RepID=UPI00130DBA41|nr:terminase small subunit [Gemmatirosa kalamazoonensis]